MNRPPAPAGSDQGGLPYALGAYTIWGFVPLFFKLLESVPPVEVLSQRIIWSLPLCFVIMLFRRQIGDYLAALKDWRVLRLLLASALLIALNWLVQRPSVATVIIGARNETQLRQNLEAVGWNLTPEQIARLDAASDVTLAYPYWHQRKFLERNPAPV